MALTGINFQANHVQQQGASRNNSSSRINLKGMEPKLYLAASSGLFEEMTSISNWKEQTTTSGNNALHVHVAKTLHETSKDHKQKVSIEFIEEVLTDDQGYSLLWKENNNDDIPLHLAARFGHKEAVQVFLERAKKVNQEEVTRMLRMVNKKKDTALHDAARGGHTAVVKLLAEADTNCTHEANEVGETPLYLAAERGSTSLVATILDTCHPAGLGGYDHKGPCGRSPLHAAVQWGKPDVLTNIKLILDISEMVRKMLEKETLLMRVQDNEGLTPLHCVAGEINKAQILKLLLQYEKEEINESSTLYIQDNKGRTPLHIAILRSNWYAIRKLIACRPDCIEIVDDHGQNAVHYAAKWGCLVKTETLVEKKGRFDVLLNDEDADGNTPLHLFAAALPNSGHGCVIRLPIFTRSNNSFLNLKAFNKQNLTVGDILASKLHTIHPDPNIQQVRSWMAPRGKRINKYEKDVDVEKADSSAKSKLLTLRKEAQGHSLVATLIATVSFAAGFTVPGGFNQNPGENIGMALLKSKAAFKVFLISDAIAFTCSTVAILSYFSLLSTESTWSTEAHSFTARILNIISLGALMLAFTTGVSVVVSHSPHLVFALRTIFMVFLFYYAVLITRTVRAARDYCARCSVRNHHVFE